MHIERVTALNQGMLNSIMQDEDAIVYALEPLCIGANNIYFLIVDGEKPVGYCDVHSVDMVGRTGWTTIYIRKTARKGIAGANDVYKQLIDYAFKSMNLRIVYADNTSKALSRWMEKSGWKYQGCLERSKFIGGKYVDHSIYALFRDSKEK